MTNNETQVKMFYTAREEGGGESVRTRETT
jgi:hypothetical protein